METGSTLRHHILSLYKFLASLLTNISLSDSGYFTDFITVLVSTVSEGFRYLLNNKYKITLIKVYIAPSYSTPIDGDTPHDIRREDHDRSMARPLSAEV